MIVNRDEIINNLDHQILSAGETLIGEFEYENGFQVRSGVPYHIYYTKDKEEIFATEKEYSGKSFLIFRKKGWTSFSQYLDSASIVTSTLFVSSTINLPTDEDYEKGEMIRYFVIKSTDFHLGMFEITKKQFEKEIPYYIKAKTRWALGSTAEKTSDFNNRSINFLKTRLKIKVVLDSLQYWKPSLSLKEITEQNLNF